MSASYYFEWQQLKLGHVFFVQTPLNAAKQSVLGRALQKKQD